MKQLLQNLRDGKSEVVEVAVPSVRPGMALVHTAVSLVSAGTERMVVEFAEKSLIGKARSRPDLVRQVVDKARREGVLMTVEAAFNRLDQPMALGYSSAGTIIAVGEGLKDFKPGDRVACAGGGFAVHAEYALVPRNLLVPLPAAVDFESAAFATLGAIALQGFRLAQPQIGERVAVIGLGLLGLLSAGIAKAAGCSVFGVDLDPERIGLGEQMGATAVPRTRAEEAGLSFSQGRGFDAVLICADTTSNDPVELAGLLARDRGTIVAVGAVGLELPRKIFFEKELQFLVSRSYGPGRYDPQYEEKGQDYPFGYVRWTEGRNIGAIVGLIAEGRLDVRPLISHRFPIESAVDAYELITGKKKEPFLGVLITYPAQSDPAVSTRVETGPPGRKTPKPSLDRPGLGVLGAGNYASAVFLPVVHRVGRVTPVGIASAGGLSARHAAKKYQFSYAGSSEEDLICDPHINLVAILTRHQHHARQVVAALENGKHVFCEKPLAISPAELEEIRAAMGQHENLFLTVGFNRRFAPFSQKIASFFQGRSEPLAAVYRVNAGFLPLTHWLHDPQQGGGRIIGEGCHFIDFLTFLVGMPPVKVRTSSLPDQGRYCQDNVILQLSFSDGSQGTLLYLANGNKSFPKERVEVFCAGRTAALDDFRHLELVEEGQREVFSARLRQDKGHRAGWEAFLETIKKGGPPPIPYDHLWGVSRAAFAGVRSLTTGCDEDV